MGYGRLFSSDGKYMGQVSNFYRKVDGNKMHIEMDNGRSLIFNPGDLLRDKQGDWHIRSMPDFYNLADIVDEAFKREALYHRGDARKEEPSMNAGSIKNVIFNPPATVVYWTDGTKTVVKCNENDIFDPEKGLALAVAEEQEDAQCIRKRCNRIPHDAGAGAVLQRELLWHCRCYFF